MQVLPGDSNLKLMILGELTTHLDAEILEDSAAERICKSESGEDGSKAIAL